MGVVFTDEQQAVIDARKCNLLVSAAAGSGKTAVLVERIIQMISSDLDVDQLLVVTFTRAAASQMKEKITDAIQKELAKDPENVHLQKQETLIHSALITTIDSFCQYVIRNNFNAIGLDPAFRVADEGEMTLLMEDVLSEMLEEEYERAREDEDSDFLFCMEYFATGNSDDKAQEYIKELYRFSMSMPWPCDWLRERTGDYSASDEDFDSLPWVRECLKRCRYDLKESADKLDSAIKIASEPDGPYMHIDNLQNEAASIRNVLKCESYDEFYTGIRGIGFARLSTKKDDSVSAYKREAVKVLRDSVKKTLEELTKKYFALTSETIKEQMKLCDRAVRELCRLTLLFKEKFDSKKREQNVIDFSDMEHFALQILVDHPGADECEGRSAAEIIDMCTPSEVALELRDYYREVLIDEYQDSNNVQELILKAISGEEAGISERFMVGDVKQSIYKFRLARPEIFMDKFRRYSREESACDRRIDLHKNFRSRAGVLEFTNYVFKRIMAGDLGGVDYDEDAMLVPGADYPEPSFDVKTELIAVDLKKVLDPPSDPVSALSSKEKEALAIASRIHELRREDKDLKYSDIVILLRSLSGWDDVFKDILEKEGIPVYTESKKGYFDAPEIAILLNMLTIIDNPRQDIPLVSVMHSAIGGFSDEELALLRIAIDKKSGEDVADSFYDGLNMDLDIGDELLERVRRFCDSIEEYRCLSTYAPVHELLWSIIDDYDYETVISAMPGGEQKRANVELLISKASEYEKSSFKGLFHFIRYIEHIRVVQVDYGEAGTIDENADVVRIMSIHKSKGLEFPVVFVSGLAKEFNTRDTTGDFIVDMDFGIGVKCIDTDLRVKYDSLKRRVISDSMKLDSLGEEIRVLYVALTRAKEKLILTTSVKDMGKMLQGQMVSLSQITDTKNALPYSVRAGAGSFFALLLPSLLLHPSMRDVLVKYEIDTQLYDRYVEGASDVPDLAVSVIGEEELSAGILKEQVELIVRKDELKAKALLMEPESGLYETLKERFSFEYPHQSLKGLFTKTTVSELKKAHMMEDGEIFADEAPFIASAEKALVSDEAPKAETSEKSTENDGKRKTALSGADRGTAYHRIMELLDENVYGDEELMAQAGRIGVTKERVSVSDRIYAFMNTLSEKGAIPPEYVQSVWSPDIVTFLSTPLGQRMGSAYRKGMLMREKPFMMGVSASELDDKFPEEEMVLVQGIIDAWFIEDGEIVLLDYKTDRVKQSQELISRYEIQLDLYRRALEAATDMKVKEVYIYSFTLSEVIRL
jgi:ATP-dependent helicase/nuclease subunit A